MYFFFFFCVTSPRTRKVYYYRYCLILRGPEPNRRVFGAKKKKKNAHARGRPRDNETTRSSRVAVLEISRSAEAFEN